MPESEFRALAELGVDELEIALRFQVPRDVVQRKLTDLTRPRYRGTSCI
jgi:hypothetical protein